jgi:phosphoribosylpyrophosphate synthetase
MVYRLGIELTKIMVLQYSNHETSVSIGESVRDEDGKKLILQVLTAEQNAVTNFGLFFFYLLSLHSAVSTSQRHQRWSYGAPYHDQCLQDRFSQANYCCNP